MSLLLHLLLRVSLLAQFEWRTTGQACIASCDGLPAHESYQSCSGCDHYVMCVDGHLFLKQCSDLTEWDNVARTCVDFSATCKLVVGR